MSENRQMQSVSLLCGLDLILAVFCSLMSKLAGFTSNQPLSIFCLLLFVFAPFDFYFGLYRPIGKREKQTTELKKRAGMTLAVMILSALCSVWQSYSQGRTTAFLI